MSAKVKLHVHLKNGRVFSFESYTDIDEEMMVVYDTMAAGLREAGYTAEVSVIREVVETR